MQERYARNIPALSREECELLGKKTVAVIGCGGLGGHIIELLARVGVGTLRVVDGDVFDSTNLNRQLLSREDALGHKKALEAARRRLCDILSSYAGFKKTTVILVFDGYKQKGNPGEKTTFHNIQVVYTKENQTADAYIEALADQIGRNYAVRVATSDALVQISSLRSGVLRMSARELRLEVEAARKEMQKHF